MNIYLLSQDENTGYDTYDSMVVYAEDEDQARKISPDGAYAWVNNGWCFLPHKQKCAEPEERGDWANKLENIKVKFLGTTDRDVKPGVICASFNAG
ncbi:hypothetical protein [Nitratifractor salsuginis]|uniref:Uncharacterized protein n=1 Tax=Nitratifractor salsuginis (strain DSM 16511 / JCM 12458 / E9I37-1) TaxID=749222 RepID=E6WYE7_NITSE|nr:hypothetical protein [Nitratifractor salsuginis]ADV46459.1 hypothetical protein Nitsa_1206 [Nitratifractor salsuginis DSM 16511]